MHTDLRRTLGTAANWGLLLFGLHLLRKSTFVALNTRIQNQRDRLAQQERELKRHRQDIVTEAVTAALALTADQIVPQTPTPFPVELPADPPPAADPRELFTVGGELLPCWQDSDLTLYDNWLSHPRNYPYYFEFFRQHCSPTQKTRLLEIGVRTGYLGVVFVRANRGPSTYVGIDPNEYVADGLVRASQTFRRLQAHRPDFEFALIEGFSNHRNVQGTARHTGPFDLIHIDGDHSLQGKLNDLDLARHLLAPNGLVLVDDYDYHPPIKDAIDRAMTLGWFRQLRYIGTMRGLAVLNC